MNTRRIFAVVCSLLVLLSSAGCQKPIGGPDPRANDDRVLVVIVPGTYSSAHFWPTVQKGKASFASELLRALPEGSQIYPHVWASSFMHENREEAAANLVNEIDRRASDFGRVCLIGHSHGGNIALLAAGRCQAELDMVICLSTPHVHLKTTKQGAQPSFLPVYCSRRTLARTRTIITFAPTTDMVSELLNLSPIKGITENTAIELASDARDMEGHPRLYRDSLLHRALPLPGFDNLVVADRLNVDTLHFDLHSLLHDRLPIIGVEVGFQAHNAVHSRRMGFVLGELVRDGPTEERVRYLEHLIQPEDADDGEPVEAAKYDAWLEKADAAFAHVGWRLERASIVLSEETADVSRDPVDPMPPDLVLRVLSPNKKQIWGKTEPVKESWKAEWQPRIFVYEGKPFILGIYNGNGRCAASLGERTLDAKEDIQGHFPADPDREVLWSGDFQWESMHF
ncbi:esterase/lipase family protein [Planctomycetota bacterium]